MSHWRKLPVITGGAYEYCNLGCGYRPEELPLETDFLNSYYGWVDVTRDKTLVERIWCTDTNRYRIPRTLQRIEDWAKKNPRHDWRVFINTPLKDVTYQRHYGHWMLVKQGQGFA